MRIAIYQSILVQNQANRKYKAPFKSKASTVSEHIRGHIFQNLGLNEGNLLNETKELPKYIKRKLLELRYKPKILIQNNIGTTKSSQEIIDFFKGQIHNFREVEPGMIYAGEKIKYKITMDNLGAFGFKHDIDFSSNYDSEYEQLLSTAGLNYTRCTGDTDYVGKILNFKFTIENAFKNNERVYMHCDWSTERINKLILAYKVRFGRSIPKKLVTQDIDKWDIESSIRMIDSLEKISPTYTPEKLKKIKNYLRNPNLLTGDLNLDKDI